MSEARAEICFLRRNRVAVGGAEMYLARLSRKLSDLGYPHRLIHSGLPRFLPSFIKVLLFNFYVCMTRKNRFYFSLERISCPDIYRAGDGVHREFLRHKRRSLNLLNPVYLYLEKRCFRNARRIIANSEMVKNEIIQHYQVSSDRISVVYSGVDSDIDRSMAGSVRQEYGIGNSVPLILFVGSGFERKGVAEMLALLAKITTPFCALIVGKDKRLKHYQVISSDLGLADRVKFIGTVNNVDRFYIDSDILMLPTRYEPFSNVVLEAMRGGNAVITTRQNGAAEVLPDEMVMNQSNDEGILPQLERLLSQPDYLEQVKRQNLEKVAGFTTEKNAVETIALIEQTLAERQQAG